MPDLLQEDLKHILLHTRDVWGELRGQRLFITGGTGFFGRWLLESFTAACERYKLGAEAVVLTRRPGAFAELAPHLAAHPAIRLHEGDVRSFVFPPGRFSHVIHAATEASAALNDKAPLVMFDTIAQGTWRVLEFAAQAGVRQFLLTSSGAVYGRQPPDVAQVPEDYCGGPDPTNRWAAYAEGKRAAEMMSCLSAQAHGFECKIARGFAFAGPFLPTDRHFAVGNFLRDGHVGGPIRVNGDGTPYRSYLYAADLAVWLWTILLRGAPGRAYNVGSDQAVTIGELAGEVAACFHPRPPIVIAKKPAPGQAPECYIPSVERARQELGLKVWIPLPEALRRWADFGLVHRTATRSAVDACTDIGHNRLRVSRLRRKQSDPLRRNVLPSPGLI